MKSFFLFHKTRKSAKITTKARLCNDNQNYSNVEIETLETKNKKQKKIQLFNVSATNITTGKKIDKQLQIIFVNFNIFVFVIVFVFIFIFIFLIIVFALKDFCPSIKTKNKKNKNCYNPVTLSFVVHQHATEFHI